jgi:hypothetical protein
VPKKSILSWEIDELTKALKINADEVQEYFTDGRRVSFILERRISREIVQGTLAESEGAAYDLLDSKGGKWEVRSLTKRGIYFCPSYMVGSGRAYEEAGFLEKLDEIEGYIVSDVVLFPNVPVLQISQQVVRDWYTSGKLGAGTRISRERALELFSALRVSRKSKHIF